MQGEEGVVVRGRVEIDTRQPFRSVREAVMLFGEQVLAGEVYGNKLKEEKKQPSKLGAVTAELEETRQCLQKAKEEGNLMSRCLSSARQELQQTKRELRKLKTRETLPHMFDEPELDEDVKFVENTTISTPGNHMHQDDSKVELQKKRSVKFASPFVTKMIDSKEAAPSTKNKKMKKKPLIPLIGGLFLRRSRMEIIKRSVNLEFNP